jgi:hypothetical protein
MRKGGIIILVGLILFLGSCTKNKYDHSFRFDERIDFVKGSWLINHIEADLHAKAKKELTDRVLRTFTKLGGNYIFFIENIRPDSLDPSPPRFNISDRRLEQIEENTIYDFLVNTKAGLNEDKDSIEFRIRIYDIDEKKITYSQKTVRPLKNERILRSSRRLYKKVRKTLKKGLRELRENVVFREY